MSDLAEIEADPAWLPHEVDEAGQRVRFLKLAPSEFGGRGFLAEVTQVQSEAWIMIEKVLIMRPVTAPLHYIFHSGFCRSTLLLQSLLVPGRTRILNEPGILNSLARTNRPNTPLIDKVVALLARPDPVGGGGSILVKPSNYPNRLIPFLMRGRPDARAIVVTNDLKSFLQAIVRKGLMGRQWARQLCFATHQYAAGSGGFDTKTLAGLTDLQLGGLAWLYTQSWFTDQLESPEGTRIKVLDGDAFNRRRGETIAAASRHFVLGIEAEAIAEIVAGPVFETHSKLGVSYAEKERSDLERSRSAVTDEEIASVVGWIKDIARVSGLLVPVRQTLLPEAPRR